MRRADAAMTAAGLPIATALALGLAWQLAVTSGGIPEYVLPAPSHVFG
jgi:ABC-type nitrate/sulfonate/bicarbonate transport system permease component